MEVKYSYTDVHSPHFLRSILSAAYDKGKRAELRTAHLPPLVLQLTTTTMTSTTTVEIFDDVASTGPYPIQSWEDELPEYTPMNW